MAEGDIVKSPLLRLPGEIRNLIYAYARETSPVALHDPAGFDGHHKRKPAAQPHPKRQWFGLTQACQQIRYEFLPMYREDTNQEVYLGDLPAYIDTFITCYGRCDSDVVGRIAIDLTRRNGSGHLNRASFDILPLLKICLAQPPGTSKLHITFIDSQDLYRGGYFTSFISRITSGNVYQDLTTFFHPMANKKWRAFVMRYLSSFVVSLSDACIPTCTVSILREYFYGDERLGIDFLPIVYGPLFHFDDELIWETRKSWAMSLRTPMPSLYYTMTVSIHSETQGNGGQ